jgi:hypothetical protein
LLSSRREKTTTNGARTLFVLKTPFCCGGGREDEGARGRALLFVVVGFGGRGWSALEALDFFFLSFLIATTPLVNVKKGRKFILSPLPKEPRERAHPIAPKESARTRDSIHKGETAIASEKENSTVNNNNDDHKNQEYVIKTCPFVLFSLSLYVCALFANFFFFPLRLSRGCYVFFFFLSNGIRRRRRCCLVSKAKKKARERDIGAWPRGPRESATSGPAQPRGP